MATKTLGFDATRHADLNLPAPTEADLALIGAAVLNSVCATLQAGHTSPASTLDYLSSLELSEGDDSAAPHIVRDFAAWTCGRGDIIPGARDRLERFVVGTGWHAALTDGLVTTP